MAGKVRHWIVAVALGVLLPVAHGSSWFALGPYGGDARSITADPQDSRHLYLGTANGWVYQSRDGGGTWERLAQIGSRNDLVIDHMLVDGKNPKRLMVGAWFIDHPDGGLYISEDAGHTWYSQAEMRGQSIRAMGRSLSNPQEIVAGTLKGVYRSLDNGVHWTQISPAGSAEIHEVQSIAIDPKDANTIYAGTWHLPWKTSDAGGHWENIKQGVIDDSDVFSIIVDPEAPNTVYASACSGIYKSDNGGVQFRKVQGIPSSARRTRKLMQDPQDRNKVFAGTTEGLYRTLDAGEKWDRLTPGDVIVNDVFVDPLNPRHVLLATDHGGVLRSEDGGETFVPSNTGFSSRQVVAYTADPHRPSTIYAGVVNDKRMGGVFQSRDGGVHWAQMSDGLGGRDVFSLLALSEGALLAGTGHGIFRFSDGQWSESSELAAPETHAVESHPGKAGGSAKPPAAHGKGKAAARQTSGRAVRPAAFRNDRRSEAAMLEVGWSAAYPGPEAQPARPRRKAAVQSRPAAARLPHPVAPALTKVDATVFALEPAGDAVYAGTTAGLLRSTDGGRTWLPLESLVMPDARFVAVHGKTVFAGTLKRLALSSDAGQSWDTIALPKDLTQIGAVGVDELSNLWVGGREGVYYSTDLGESWKILRNLFITQVDNLYFDTASHRMLVTSMGSTFAFAVSVPEYKVRYWDTGWALRFARPVGDHLIGATLFDGMIVQPQMVDSAFPEQKTAGK